MEGSCPFSTTAHPLALQSQCPQARVLTSQTEKELSLSPVGKWKMPTLGTEITGLFMVYSWQARPQSERISQSCKPNTVTHSTKMMLAQVTPVTFPNLPTHNSR